MDNLKKFKEKPALTPAEARSVLQLIQLLTAPVLSTRGSNCFAQVEQGLSKPEVLSFSKANEPAVKHHHSLNISSFEDFPALSVQSK